MAKKASTTTSLKLGDRVPRIKKAAKKDKVSAHKFMLNAIDTQLERAGV